MRATKILRDASHSAGRMISIAMAIAVGIASVAAVSTAYGIIGREINRGYLATLPASAEIEIDHLDEADLAAVRSHPSVKWAQGGGRESLRVRVSPNVWLPLLLFVVPEFADQHMNLIKLESGEWPATAGEIVLERTAMPLANAAVVGQVVVRTAQGVENTLIISGVVHDPSLAPAAQQQTVYGYATPATLRSLGLATELHLLKIAMTDPDVSPESAIVDIAEGLIRAGHRLGEVRIPPRQHPHWGLMVNVVNLLLGFSLLIFLLSSVLTAALTANFLAPQVRQIGVMKALGARDRQIISMYAGLVCVIGIVAVTLGIPVGCAAGRALARYVAVALNFDLRSVTISGAIYLGEAMAGVGLPLLLALGPIVRAARRPVREALDDHGASIHASTGSVALGWKVARMAFTLRFAVRNSLRRRSRLMLTLVLLASAGALFIVSSSLSAAWQQEVAAAVAERRYDLEIAFAGPQVAATALAVAAAVPGVMAVEDFSDEPVSIARADGINLTHTFPDGGHGSLRLDALRPASALLKFALAKGTWLRRSAAGVGELDVVLNSAALAFFPGLELGGRIRVLARGKVLSLKMIGLIAGHLAPATLYVSADAAAAALDEPGFTRGLRVSLARGDEAFALEVAGALERSLDTAGVQVAGSSSKAQIGREYGGHLYIVIFTLGVMTVLVAIVGILGLGSCMGTNVLERTREFAVMRAIGASRLTIFNVVIAEGLFVGALSVACASLLALPLTLAAANTVGLSSVGIWQSIGLSVSASPLWLAIVLTGAAGASAYPAHTATRLTIHAALAYQ